jgi:hypothetical protein
VVNDSDDCALRETAMRAAALVLAEHRGDDEGVMALSRDAGADMAEFLAGVIAVLFEALAEKDGRDSAEDLVLEWQARNFDDEWENRS